jgi:hypothetical protein
MKSLDVIAAVLVVIGALNWGLVGLFGLNLVALIFGDMTILSRLVYVIVGIAGVYQAIEFKAIQRRWGGAPTVAHT